MSLPESNRPDRWRQQIPPAEPTAASALVAIHRYLFPENYANVDDFEWSADTVDHVAGMVADGLRAAGVATAFYSTWADRQQAGREEA